MQALYDVQNRFTALLEPGAAPPVDAILFLRYVPEILAPWKRKAREIRRDQRELYFRLYNATKQRMASGIRTGCFMEKLIEEQGKNGLSDEHTAYLGGILMEAGSDTTSSTLLSFLLAVIENPDALKRAQEDVDRVVGVERSPTMQDLEDLPYIEACMHEVGITIIQICIYLLIIPLGPPLETRRSRRNSPSAYPDRHIQGLRLPRRDNLLRKHLGHPP